MRIITYLNFLGSPPKSSVNSWGQATNTKMADERSERSEKSGENSYKSGYSKGRTSKSAGSSRMSEKGSRGSGEDGKPHEKEDQGWGQEITQESLPEPDDNHGKGDSWGTLDNAEGRSGWDSEENTEPKSTERNDNHRHENRIPPSPRGGRGRGGGRSGAPRGAPRGRGRGRRDDYHSQSRGGGRYNGN